jgi:hypothetical protein
MPLESAALSGLPGQGLQELHHLPRPYLSESSNFSFASRVHPAEEDFTAPRGTSAEVESKLLHRLMSQEFTPRIRPSCPGFPGPHLREYLTRARVFTWSLLLRLAGISLLHGSIGPPKRCSTANAVLLLSLAVLVASLCVHLSQRTFDSHAWLHLAADSGVLAGCIATHAVVVHGTRVTMKLLHEVQRVQCCSQDATPLWARRSSEHCGVCVVLFVLSMSAMVQWHYTWVIEDVSLACFAFISILSTASTAAILHITEYLRMQIDLFCGQLLRGPDVVTSIRAWNIIQATMRRSSSLMGGSFFSLQCTATWMLLSVIGSAFFGGPHLQQRALCLIPLLMGSTRVLYEITCVTAKCERMPAMISNAFVHGDTASDKRVHFLVEHIRYSDAGLFIQNVRIGPRMVLNLSSYIFALIFAVATRVVVDASAREAA